MNAPTVLVVGGGPAGLMAAFQAAEAGGRVTLLEKMDRPGRKLSLTGNGRCNITNTASLERFLAAFGRNGPFLRQAFHRFFKNELLDFLHGQGLETREEEEGKIYLACNRAEEAVALFERLLREKEVGLRLSSSVEKIDAAGGRIRAAILRSGERISADALILAAGGASYPGTGSSGDGFRLASGLGHTIVPVRPALVPLVSADPAVRSLQGTTVPDAALALKLDGRIAARSRGGLLFTHFGLSGPAALLISGKIPAALSPARLTLEIDLMPDASSEEVNRRLQAAADAHGKRSAQNLLAGTVPDRIAPLLLSGAEIEGTAPAHQIRKEQRKSLATLMKGWPVEIAGPRPLAEAMVTAGGVALDEIEPRSMASRLVKGLYFAGEVMDLDGETGGFNLQAAFSTGWTAGRSIKN